MSPFFRPVLPLMLGALVTACGNKNTDKDNDRDKNRNEKTHPTPESSSSAPKAPDTPPGWLSVVLVSPSPIAFSGLRDGVAVANDERTSLATATGDQDLVTTTMPEGLPAEGRILGFAGKLPGSLWLLFEDPATENKEFAKNPLYRLERRKNSWKRFAEDWKPHFAPWSKNRILAMSTSSGKLKVKVVEPFQDSSGPDLPGPQLDDEPCAKSLRIAEIAALPSGEVFAAASCNFKDAGRRYVVVRWAEQITPPTTSASAIAAPSALTTPSTAPTSNASAIPKPSANTDITPPPTDGGPVDAGAADARETKEPTPQREGIPGKVWPIPDGGLEHRALVVHDPNDAWVLAKDKSDTSRLYRLYDTAFKAETLPSDITGTPHALAGAADGILWLATSAGIWKRYPVGNWEKVPPPAWPSSDPNSKWEMLGVWAAGGDVWISAKYASAKEEGYALLRRRPAKTIVRW